MSRDCSKRLRADDHHAQRGAAGLRRQDGFHRLIEQFSILCRKSAVVECWTTSHLQ